MVGSCAGWFVSGIRVQWELRIVPVAVRYAVACEPCVSYIDRWKLSSVFEGGPKPTNRVLGKYHRRHCVGKCGYSLRIRGDADCLLVALAEQLIPVRSAAEMWVCSTYAVLRLNATPCA